MSDRAWRFVDIWNGALQANKERPHEPRDYIWASELGGSYYDRYWRMKGRKPSTPPNLRSRRKFEGGNLTEWIVLQVLLRAKVLRSTQEHIVYDKGPLKVTGKADFVAGGLIQDIKPEDLVDLPDTFGVVAEVTVARLKEKFPDGLMDVNIELKSCAGVMFDKYRQAPNTHHGLQAFHYAHNTGRPTILIYVSRDDFRICEWVIYPNSPKWKQLYDQDIEMMAEVLALDEKQIKSRKEPLLTFDGKKFSKNWKVEYSNWLTHYGFRYPEQYAKPAQSAALRLSNIVKKIRDGKPIDGKVNQKTLEECYKFFPPAQAIIERLQA